MERTLDALTKSAEDGHVHGSLDGNLLALAVDAARAKATVGEVSGRWRRSTADTKP